MLRRKGESLKPELDGVQRALNVMDAIQNQGTTGACSLTTFEVLAKNKVITQKDVERFAQALKSGDKALQGRLQVELLNKSGLYVRSSQNLNLTHEGLVDVADATINDPDEPNEVRGLIVMDKRTIDGQTTSHMYAVANTKITNLPPQVKKNQRFLAFDLANEPQTPGEQTILNLLGDKEAVKEYLRTHGDNGPDDVLVAFLPKKPRGK